MKLLKLFQIACFTYDINLAEKEYQEK